MSRGSVRVGLGWRRRADVGVSRGTRWAGTWNCLSQPTTTCSSSPAVDRSADNKVARNARPSFEPSTPRTPDIAPDSRPAHPADDPLQIEHRAQFDGVRLPNGGLATLESGGTQPTIREANPSMTAVAHPAALGCATTHMQKIDHRDARRGQFSDHVERRDGTQGSRYVCSLNGCTGFEGVVRGQPGDRRQGRLPDISHLGASVLESSRRAARTRASAPPWPGVIVIDCAVVSLRPQRPQGDDRPSGGWCGEVAMHRSLAVQPRGVAGHLSTLLHSTPTAVSRPKGARRGRRRPGGPARRPRRRSGCRSRSCRALPTRQRD